VTGKRFLPGLIVLAGGCTGHGSAEADMRRQLDGIAAQCRLPASVFDLRAPDELHFRPAEDAPYEDVECAVTALRKAHLPMKVGYVGNESYVMGNGQ
jgi:hypothetical protein